MWTGPSKTRKNVSKCEKTFSDGKRKAAKHTSHTLSKPNRVGVELGERKVGKLDGQ